VDTITVDEYDYLCNAAGSRPAAPKRLVRACSNLVRRLKQHQRVTGDPVAVFDGSPVAPHSLEADALGPQDTKGPPLRVIHTRGRDADAAIESLVRQNTLSASHAKPNSVRGSLFVVTEDRALGTRLNAFLNSLTASKEVEDTWQRTYSW